MAIRKRLHTLPTWSGVFEQWSRKWVSKNYWRVSHIHGSQEDSLQECALVFSRCVARYAGKVDNHAWFMALYKRALANEWHTCSVRDTRNRDLSGPSLDDDALVYKPGEATDLASSNWGAMLVQLRGCGTELLDVLACIAMAPAQLLATLTPKADAQALSAVLGTDDDFILEAARAFMRVKLTESPAATDEIINDLCDILQV